MTCEEVRKISDLGDISRAERAALVKHIDNCHSCLLWICEGDDQKLEIIKRTKAGDVGAAARYFEENPSSLEELTRALKDHDDPEFQRSCGLY